MEGKGYEYLTITPISKNVKNKACIDYAEQEKRTSMQGFTPSHIENAHFSNK
jgi:hypothetical protein